MLVAMFLYDVCGRQFLSHITSDPSSYCAFVDWGRHGSSRVMSDWVLRFWALAVDESWHQSDILFVATQVEKNAFNLERLSKIAVDSFAICRATWNLDFVTAPTTTPSCGRTEDPRNEVDSANWRILWFGHAPQKVCVLASHGRTGTSLKWRLKRWRLDENLNRIFLQSLQA